jgi:hypothetical protein
MPPQIQVGGQFTTQDIYVAEFCLIAVFRLMWINRSGRGEGSLRAIGRGVARRTLTGPRSSLPDT